MQSFSRYNLACNLQHVDYKRVEAMEGLLYILYNRVDNIVFWPDLARIFIVRWGTLKGEEGE